MKINYDYEPVIILKDLCFELLYRWRSILVAALIGALLLGGYQYYTGREKKSAPAQTAQTTLAPEAQPAAEEAQPEEELPPEPVDPTVEDFSQRLEEYNLQLEQYKTQLQKYNLNYAMYQSRIENNQALINDLEDYMAHSVYYNLDAATLHSVVRTYLVKLNQDGQQPLALQNLDPANDLLVLYSYALRDDLRSDQMKALLGTDEERYIEELVEIKSNTSSNTLELIVRGSSDEMVSKAMEFFHERLMKACADEMQSIYPHQLLTVNDAQNLYDQKALLVDAQQKQLQNLIKYQNAIADAEKARDKLEVPVEPEPLEGLQVVTGAQPGMEATDPADAQTALEETDPADEQSGSMTVVTIDVQTAQAWAKAREKEQKQQIGTRAAIGFALMLVLMAVYHAVRYLTGERLRDSAEMTRRYGLLVFEDAPHSRARRPGKGIDGLIERLEFGKKLDRAGVGRQAALLLGKAVPEGSSLALVSTRPEEKLGQVRGALAEALRAKDIQVICTADSLREDRMAGIPDGAKLVVVEEKHESKIAGITREAELVSMLRQDAVGSILL